MAGVIERFTEEARHGAPLGVGVRIDGIDLRELGGEVSGFSLLLFDTLLGRHWHETPHPSFGPDPDFNDADGLVNRSGVIAVLNCSFSIPDCGGLFTRLQRRPGAVVWTEFLVGMGHRIDLGPFVFEELQYFRALRDVNPVERGRAR